MRLARTRSPIHIAIRSITVESDSDVVGKVSDAVAEHNLISSKHSRVFFGKVGRKPDERRLEQVRRAVQAGQSAKLILVRKGACDFEAFSARMLGIHWQGVVPPFELVPSYYHSLAPDIKVWFEIGSFSRISLKELNRLELVSSGRTLLETLKACRTSLMFVQ